MKKTPYEQSVKTIPQKSAWLKVIAMGCKFFPLEFSILKGVDLAKALKEGHVERVLMVTQERI